MDGKTLVTRIALLIIGFSLLNAVLWGVLVGTRGSAGNVAGLVINVVLALFLISGQGVTLDHGCSLWCGGHPHLCLLDTAGESERELFLHYPFVVLFSVLFSAVIGVYLVLSKRVSDHFNPGSGF